MDTSKSHGHTSYPHLMNVKADYYDRRDRFNDLIASGDDRNAEAAGLFYYLNRTGFNGLCRFNQSGLYNVSVGDHKTINYTKYFTHYIESLAGSQITCGDFEAVNLSPSDFIYADPPYDGSFTQYAKGGFTWDDQVRLAEWLSRHPGPVVLSNKATDRIMELYEGLGFELRQLKAPRRISCDGDRTPAAEVLALRNVFISGSIPTADPGLAQGG